MPDVKIKKKRKKNLGRRVKKAIGRQSAMFYVSLVIAFLLAIFVAQYLLRHVMNAE